MQKNNRGSSLVKLLPAVWMIASILYGTSGNSEFFLIGSDLKTCKTVAELNKAHCKNSEGLELHCVLDEDYELGLGYLPKIWVPIGNCPFYRNDYGVIDYRPCVAEASACPNDTDWYLSTDVYKYPVCLQESKTARGSIQTNGTTTEDTGIRSTQTTSITTEETGIRSTQTTSITTEDTGIRKALVTVGMDNPINFSCQCPWKFVWPICLGLLILAVLNICALGFLLLKDRKWKECTSLFNYGEKKLKYSTGEPQSGISRISQNEAVHLPLTNHTYLNTSVWSVESETGVNVSVSSMDGWLKTKYADHLSGFTLSRDERYARPKSYPP